MSRKLSATNMNTNKSSTGKSAEKALFDKTQNNSPTSEEYDEVIKIEIKFGDLINLDPLLKLIKLLEKDLEARQISPPTPTESQKESKKVLAPIPTQELSPKKFDKERKRREYVRGSELKSPQ
ncbi:unnamed protein product [Caenorhabditis angaria]|uniref:Uncharacterized protein n=1 Tax=Caenorhabditis angaria TaxID=860376 RepID=A0A9P1MWT8_9PELO|nr:unnamed protein product [Caenorhabditis angaria]